jgi:hypothetical protein
MRAGLDHKVFVAALDIQSGKTKNGLSSSLGTAPSPKEVIDHYASSRASAQIMHDRLAGQELSPDNANCCMDDTLDSLTRQMEAMRTHAIQEVLWCELSRVKKEGNTPAEEPIRQLIGINMQRLDQIVPDRDADDL